MPQCRQVGTLATPQQQLNTLIAVARSRARPVRANATQAQVQVELKQGIQASRALMRQVTGSNAPDLDIPASSSFTTLRSIQAPPLGTPYNRIRQRRCRNFVTRLSRWWQCSTLYVYPASRNPLNLLACKDNREKTAERPERSPDSAGMNESRPHPRSQSESTAEHAWRSQCPSAR
jgi:hypothetical protein